MTAGEESYWQYHAMESWFKNAPPVLIVLATVGNIVSIVTLQNPIFFRRKLHHRRTTQSSLSIGLSIVFVATTVRLAFINNEFSSRTRFFSANTVSDCMPAVSVDKTS